MFASLRRWLQGFASPPLPPLETGADITAVFTDLIRAHGYPCTLEDGWIVADGGLFAAQARLPEGVTGSIRAVQLDFEVRLPSGAVILESCGGFGSTPREARGDAIRNFCEGSFHVLFSALTGIVCSHCHVETWQIGGHTRRAFVGAAVTRGAPPKLSPLVPRWFAEMQRRIVAFDLSPDLHWIRLFHGAANAIEPISEALLDNDTWPSLQSAVAEFDWPRSEQYFSVRLFLIIEALPGSPPATIAEPIDIH